MPDYLRVWPYMKNELQIATYLKQLTKSGLLVESFSTRAVSSRIVDATTFHASLKAALNQ